jgi:hypothetical protein
MAVKGLTLSTVKVIESVMDDAKGTEAATKFIIGAIDAFVSTHVYDMTLVFGESDVLTETIDDKGVKTFAKTQTAQVMLNKSNLEVVRFGLKGWDGFKDDKSNDILFTTVTRIVNGKQYTVVSDDCLGRMDVMLIRELANQIRTINVLTTADAVKSDAA